MTGAISYADRLGTLYMRWVLWHLFSCDVFCSFANVIVVTCSIDSNFTATPPSTIDDVIIVHKSALRATALASILRSCTTRT